jgi:hypothetical protein
MTLVRYGQAAMIAAIMVVTGNAVWAQELPSQGYAAPRAIYFSMKPECCKDGKCCKEGDCCANSKKCEAKCTCGKDSKCACCKDGECCCDKDGKCSCGKDKTSATKIGCGCCPFMNTLAKHTAIIMVMPASMPLPACCLEAMGMIPHPPMPPGPHVFLPPMMPPMPPIPPTPSMVMPPMPNICVPCPDGNAAYNDWTVGLRLGMPMINGVAGAVACGPACSAPVSASKFEISAPPSSDQVEMSVGDETCIRAKKMTIKIGDKAVTVSRFDDRVRVRGEELKATANTVRSDGKSHLILEGDVVLRCKKDGHAPTYGDRIELDLSNCAMTIERAPKIPAIGITPVIHEGK